MRTIKQRIAKESSIRVVPLSDDTRMCTSEYHEGERLLPTSEFYGRSTVCKRCAIKKKQESRRQERLVRMENTYNQYPFILNNKELLVNSKRLFKPGFISEASVIHRILKQGNEIKYNPTFNEFRPYPPTLIEFESRESSPIKNYWFVSAKSDGLAVCRYLIYPGSQFCRRHVVMYGEMNDTHLSFIADACTNYNIDLELVNERTVRFE